MCCYLEVPIEITQGHGFYTEMNTQKTQFLPQKWQYPRRPVWRNKR